MTINSFGHTAHYTYIDSALRSRWPSFRELELEMDQFIPKPLSDFAEQGKAELERLRVLNPDSPVESLAVDVNRSIANKASYQWQFYARFDERQMSEYVTVVLLSHALCEALINAALAIGLTKAGSPELFSLVERADFKQKWTTAPKSFYPAYKFPRGTALYESLIHLARQRNSLVHHKIELTHNGTKVLDGSGFERKTYAEEMSWLRRFFSLPYDLAEFLHQHIQDVPLMLLFERKPIERAPAHSTA
jgi:hypothetical protein